ncbi:MAG: beta/gamma crystallin-related protein [Candidatus Poribacteria bacterium]
MYMLSRIIIDVFEQPNFQGRKVTICDPIKNIRQDIGFDGNVASCIVYQGPNFATSPNEKAIFFEKVNFQGQQLVLAPGYYENLQNGTYNLSTIQSIKMSSAMRANGPSYGQIPIVLELFSQPSFKGAKTTVLKETNNTQQLRIPDTVSSLIIRKGPDFPRAGCKVMLYQQPDFAGEGLPIEMRPYTPQVQIPNVMANARQPLTIGSIKIAA